MVIRICLTKPFVKVASTPLEGVPTGMGLEDHLYDRIMDSVYAILLEASFLEYDTDGTGKAKLKPVITRASGTIQERLFSANFYAFFDDSGKVNQAQIDQFSDTQDHDRLSWFTRMGDILKVRYGIERMEVLANRLFHAYYPDMPEPSWYTDRQKDIALFGQYLWPLFLAHHAVTSAYYGDVIR